MFERKRKNWDNIWKGLFFIMCHGFKCLCKTQTRLTFFLKGPSERFKCFGNAAFRNGGIYTTM